VARMKWKYHVIMKECYHSAEVNCLIDGQKKVIRSTDVHCRSETKCNSNVGKSITEMILTTSMLFSTDVYSLSVPIFLTVPTLSCGTCTISKLCAASECATNTC
jgi:hypothetical protein